METHGIWASIIFTKQTLSTPVATTQWCKNACMTMHECCVHSHDFAHTHCSTIVIGLCEYNLIRVIVTYQNIVLSLSMFYDCNIKSIDHVVKGGPSTPKPVRCGLLSKGESTWDMRRSIFMLHDYYLVILFKIFLFYVMVALRCYLYINQQQQQRQQTKTHETIKTAALSQWQVNE